jgi:hypothetical protein
VKVGDLVTVGPRHVGAARPFASIILEICLPDKQRNRMHLIKVLDKWSGQLKWYPVGYIRAIDESR